MKLTPAQLAVVQHPLGSHAMVRAAPGAGKTTTLIARVGWLLEQGAEPDRLRVVMFNRSVKQTFLARLEHAGLRGVRVSTFDALGLAVLREAERRGMLSRRLTLDADGLERLARQVHRAHTEDIESAEDIAAAVSFWKACMVPPGRAAFPSTPAYVDAYTQLEALRVHGDTLRVTFSDMVYTAVAVLRRHPRLLGPIDHLLVDEFQDVNPARVELLQRLVSPQTDIMVVGDPDQAINEWQGANPRLFADFAARFDQHPTRDYRLPHSFRFGSVIAEAAQRLIAHDADRVEGDIVGLPDAPGGIHVVESVLDGVRQALGDHPPHQVAVLYRARTEGVGALVALALAGQPVDTVDANLLRHGKGPALALNTLEAAAHDRLDDRDAVWSVVMGPDRYIRKQAFLSQLQSGRYEGLRALLRDSAAARHHGQSESAIQAMRDLARLLERMAACPTAARALDLMDAHSPADEALRQRIHGQPAQEVAIASFHATRDLLAGLDTPVGEAANTIRELDVTMGAPALGRIHVGTIHAAKGMEWQAVVLAGMSEGACPAARRGAVPGTVEQPKGVNQSDWLAQERRVFFVGLTRAARAVWVHAPSPRSRFLDEAGLVPADSEEPAARQGKAWSADEDHVVAMFWQSGRDLPTLARTHGRSETAVAARLVHLGVVGSRDEARRRAPSGPPARHSRPAARPTPQRRTPPQRRGARWTPEDEATLRELHESGQPMAAMQERLHRSRGAISRRLVRLGLVEER